jgi:hypothetical protein
MTTAPAVIAGIVRSCSRPGVRLSVDSIRGGWPVREQRPRQRWRGSRARARVPADTRVAAG